MKSSRHDIDAGVLACDMIVKESDLLRIIGAISSPLKVLAPIRTYCMNCKVSTQRPSATSMTKLMPSSLVTKSMPIHQNSTTTKLIHCQHCSRSVCTNCCKVSIPMDAFGKNPKTHLYNGSSPQFLPCCIVCEKILLSQKEVTSHDGTQPTTTTTSYGSSGAGQLDTINSFLFESDDNDDADRYSC